MEKLKKIWKSILPYFDAIFNLITSKIFIVSIVIIFVLLFIRSCADIRDYQRQIFIRDQNILALTDTIKTEKTKSGKLQESIAGYIATEKELRLLNESLFKEVADQKGQVLSLNKVVFQLRQDATQLRAHINYLESIINQPIQLNDSTYKLTWTKRYDWDKTNYDIFQGQTIVGLNIKPGYSWREAFELKYNIFDLIHYDSEIIGRETQIDLVLGQRVENKQLRVFVQSNYPGFTAKSLEGVLIDPNSNQYIQDLITKKKWFPNTWSIGVGPSFGYDIFSKSTYLGIGVNINYNIIQW